MNEPAKPTKTGRRAWWVFVPCLFIVLSLAPSMGRIVRDHPQGPGKIVYPPEEVLLLSFIALVPGMLVYFGAKRSRLVEIVGWILFGITLWYFSHWIGVRNEFFDHYHERVHHRKPPPSPK